MVLGQMIKVPVEEVLQLYELLVAVFLLQLLAVEAEAGFQIPAEHKVELVVDIQPNLAD